MRLEERKREDGGRTGIYFNAYSDSGKKYSVVNIGKLMETDASYDRRQWLEYWANTWESAELLENGEINTDTIERARSWEALDKLLTEKENPSSL